MIGPLNKKHGVQWLIIARIPDLAGERSFQLRPKNKEDLIRYRSREQFGKCKEPKEREGLSSSRTKERRVYAEQEANRKGDGLQGGSWEPMTEYRKGAALGGDQCKKVSSNLPFLGQVHRGKGGMLTGGLSRPGKAQITSVRCQRSSDFKKDWLSWFSLKIYLVWQFCFFVPWVDLKASQLSYWSNYLWSMSSSWTDLSWITCVSLTDGWLRALAQMISLIHESNRSYSLCDNLRWYRLTRA